MQTQHNENQGFLGRQRKNLPAINVISFITALSLNFLQSKYGRYANKQISDMWALKITPADQAFAIWGIIYSLLTAFTIYQALPKKWVPSRNDKLIYEDIGFWFGANLI